MLRSLLALPMCVMLFVAPVLGDTRAKDRVALVFGMAAYQNVTAL